MIIYDNDVFILFPLLIYFFTKNWYITIFFIVFFLIFMNSPNKKNNTYDKNIFYSPSSGYVRKITSDSDNTRISLFLNVLDNHTQYFPVRSSIISRKRIRGLFLPAYKEHSINNERVENTLQAIDNNFQYKLIQITGLLTRRIKDLSDTNKVYDTGERLGFIVLGSRVDIIIPNNNISTLLIKEGQSIKEMDEMVKLK